MSHTRRYYAVRIGRQGPRIYDSYSEFAGATIGFSGSSGKGFDNIHDAQEWLTGYQLSLFPGVGTIHTNINVNLNLSHEANINPGNVASSSSTATFAAPQNAFPNGPFSRYDQAQGVSMERPPPPAPKPHVELSEEQNSILELVKSGQNIFFTGPAGTGKSVLLRAIIDDLRLRYGPGHQVAITAPTGIAGLNIGGRTLHSWAGIGNGKEPWKQLREALSLKAVMRWQEAQALLIDEVSMLDGRLFDKLEAIARDVREDNRPFGGIQLIASGDFFQLPPVPDQDSTSKIEATFAFQARSWNRCIDHMVQLTKVFRQKDRKFVEILSSMRMGVLEDWHKEELQKLSREIHYDDGISPTQLFPLNFQVERHNLECLGKLSGETLWYEAMDARGCDMYGVRLSVLQAEKLLERQICPKMVPLKVGAQVMLLRNMLQGELVNGSLGKVVEFISTHDAQQRYLEIADMERRKEGRVSLTVNPSDTNENAPGLIALNHHEFRKDQLWPVVKFTNGRILLCSPIEFTVQGLSGSTEARRLQIPLSLSWAMSIHKSQGQTLSRVKVDLARIFEKGQAYVAISRSTGMEGLQIDNFNPVKVLAHPDVIKWQTQWDRDRNQEEEMDSEWAVSQWHESFHE